MFCNQVQHSLQIISREFPQIRTEVKLNLYAFCPFSSSLKYAVSLNIQRFLCHEAPVFSNYFWSSLPLSASAIRWVAGGGIATVSSLITCSTPFNTFIFGPNNSSKKIPSWTFVIFLSVVFEELPSSSVLHFECFPLRFSLRDHGHVLSSGDSCFVLPPSSTFPSVNDQLSEDSRHSCTPLNRRYFPLLINTLETNKSQQIISRFSKVMIHCTRCSKNAGRSLSAYISIFNIKWASVYIKEVYYTDISLVVSQINSSALDNHKISLPCAVLLR